jgi:hypothetical protein
MANPRNTVSYEGIAGEYVTFKIDDSTITYDATQTNGSAQVGKAVTFSDADTVQLVGDGELVVGKLIKVEADDKALVQVGGYMTLPGGSGAALTQGEQIVGDLGAEDAEGYIRAVATNTAAELGHCRGMIINPDTATAVVVRL